MSALIDIERLQKIFGRKGEKVVIVVPGQDPVVLVPLTEYEQYEQGKRPPTAGEPKVNKPPQKPQSIVPKLQTPESVDPLQGGLEDDDQYFPEPL
ncbi:MAG TPA: hypothetical protein DEA87_00665 [Candidatus Veblenbacteria bacterium]|uniref:Uncharacterized protein n=2 Tax=Candidatus Vebleniibacteriota TaxID=1817921 RepID=A0A1G2Q419_9BACT|nr:MAG: hypothetical protein A2226_01885 [Candidatus Veblenbacteria bacterium RIFOXYA2_FULL_43_9]OHA57458.1 MAG: hypothetical protein A2441_02765 [Candidatus Veblenbacteria bacterium RIFOXYC2_FULL_42_11]HAO81179.1 hypothetical protein [Candidatus Veblenbacteria bacterium]HBT91989.1 hypothetical protein [Candidatus Veblenbacteria bacterium]